MILGRQSPLRKWIGRLLAVIGVLLSTMSGWTEELPPSASFPEQLSRNVEEEAPIPRRETSEGGSEQGIPALTLAVALRWTIEPNPQLALVRKQRGIAQAGILIAKTYPFNPIFQHFLWADSGPAAAGITNRLFQEHTSRLDLELRNQGTHRRSMAQAALSRTEWEIAAQEVLVAVQMVRAFDTVLYRQGSIVCKRSFCTCRKR